MGNQKSGLLVVVFDNEGEGGISEWFEYSRERPDEVVNLLKYMRVRPEWSLNKYFFSKKLGLGSI